MKVIGYVRVSTEEQRDHGTSLAAQEAKIRLYCELHDLELVCIISDGDSGKSLNRPGIKEALEMLRSKQTEGIVIAKLDRLSRNVGDWSMLVTEYFSERAGKHLLCCAEPVDTRSAVGRLGLNILMSVSQWEREAIGERTRDVMAYRRSIGKCTGHVPFGFDLSHDGETLVANPGEQAILKQMVAMKDNGMSLEAIAVELNRRGVPSKQSTRRGKRQPSGRWVKSAVHGILRRVAA